jgi:hypothetical protein
MLLYPVVQSVVLYKEYMAIAFPVNQKKPLILLSVSAIKKFPEVIILF